MSEEIKEEKNKVETNNTKTTKKKQTTKNTTTKKQITENENNLELTKTKNVKNTLTVKQQKELETIEKEIKAQETKAQEKMGAIYGNVFKNILYAIIVVLYFIFIIVGYNLIEQNLFIIVLKVLSMLLIITTICIFEKAYKKDSGKLTIIGIEFLVVSICTLLSIRTYMLFNNKFVSSIASFALLFSIYYVGKAIRVYIKESRQVKKEVNDIMTRKGTI